MPGGMTALFEGGNSRLHFAWWNGSTLVDPVDTPYPASGDSFAPMIESLLEGVTPRGAAAASVSPTRAEPLFSALETLFPGGVRIVRNAPDAGIEVAYDHPESFGIDRALAALAAFREVCGPCVVVDAGTAVTVDAVDGNGTIRGGFIFPGAETLSHGLAARTGLPFVRAAETATGPGTSTEDCIGSALALGLGGAVRALVVSAAGALGGTGRVLVTGGGGAYLSRILGVTECFRPHLALTGLGIVSDTSPKRA